MRWHAPEKPATKTVPSQKASQPEKTNDAPGLGSVGKDVGSRTIKKILERQIPKNEAAISGIDRLMMLSADIVRLEVCMQL